jgi:D-alanine-D-alanine ligase-like ATP-grasp enzyme
MKTVIFVSPFYREATLRYVRAALRLDDVQVALISQAPLEEVEPGLRSKIAAHYRIPDCFDAKQLAFAANKIAAHLGRPIDRLIGILEQLQVPVAEARDLTGIDGMGSQIVRNFRDKARMKTLLRRAGLPCANYRVVASARALWEFIEEQGLPVVIKPLEGAGSVATYRVDTAQQVARLLSSSLQLSPQQPVIVEEFLLGTEQSFETMSDEGNHLWSSWTRYRPRPLEVVDNPWIQWTVLLPAEASDPDFEAFRPLNHRALTALGMRTGISHMEWFKRPDGTMALSEVGSRPPGAQIMSLMSLAHETDMYFNWVRLLIHGQFDPPARVYAAGAAFLRAQGRGDVIKAVHGLEGVLGELGDLVVEGWRNGECEVSTQRPNIGWKQSSSYEGDGFVIVRHKDTAVVREALDLIIKKVRVELG